MVEDFTPIFEGYADARVSFTEAEALRPFYDAGEPARLREDIRFRSTPWGRWARPSTSCPRECRWCSVPAILGFGWLGLKYI